MADNNEVLEKVCAVRRKFDELVQHHTDDTNFTDSVMAALNESEFPTEKKIRQDYKKAADIARHLRIGIVGAVKAGKSSLLNSLFFEGKDILPKAATPMTAALTEITYGTGYSVTVDFFTDEDIRDLKKNSDDYERRLDKTIRRKTKEIEENWRRAQMRKDPLFAGEPGAKDREQWDKASKSSALAELRKNTLLTGAWERYQMIRNSSEQVKADVQRKAGSVTFSVGSVSEIAGRLEDYVGADGKYMPFTSKVKITLSDESFRGIDIVDTPGYNDPVPSRDERARQALSDCDVILILSRASQFLAQSDMEVISKITRKNGLREIYLVSSQVDSTLLAQEIVRESEGDMDAALSIVTEQLSSVVSQNLSAVNWSGVFDQLVKEAPRWMFLTSGLCESMARTFDERDSWDGGRTTVWHNLCESYSDFFSDSDMDTSIASLRRLGNSEKIRKCINDVKKNKSEIFRDRLEKFGRRYSVAAKEACRSILRGLEAREAEIKRNDIGQIEKLIKQLEQSCENIRLELDEVFRSTVNQWYNSVKSEYDEKLSSLRESVLEALNSEITRTGGFWGNSVTVHVSVVKTLIHNYINEYNEFSPHFLDEQLDHLRDNVITSVTRTWMERGVAGYERDAGFRNRVANVISGVVINYDLKYSDVPELLQQQKDGLIDWVLKLIKLWLSSFSGIENMEGFIDKAKSTVISLDGQFKKILHNAVSDVEKKCKGCDFSKCVLDPYIKQLENRKKSMEKPKLALENIMREKEEVETIKF